MKLMNGLDLILDAENISYSESEKGWVVGNTVYSDVEKKYTVVENNITLSPIAFKLRFTAPERIAIYQSTDLIVKDFISLLDDIRLQSVDLTLQSTIDAIDYLVSISLVTPERKDAILS